MRDSESSSGPGLSLLIDDAAAMLNVSRRTVYYRIREGRLATIRTRCGSQRVLMRSIQALLAGSASEALEDDAAPPVGAGG